VIVYEALLNQFFGSVRASGMCQYDCNRLPPTLIHYALATHTSVACNGSHRVNPFHERGVTTPPFTSKDDVRRKLKAVRASGNVRRQP
jgi:hypothetical protein